MTGPATFAVAFLAGGRLWLLAAVAALLAAYVVMQVRRRRYAVRFTNIALLDTVAPRRPGWRRHLPAAAFLLGVAAMVLAFARPAEEVEVPRERATLVVAIDTSLSMEANDVRPSRLAAVQQAATTFLEELPESINVGLVTFDGIARVAVSPTTDHALVARAVAELDLGEGTAIGEAIFASLDAVKQAPPSENPDEPVPAAVVLMSDGETTVGRPNEEGMAAASEAAVPVSTIAFGTDMGTITVPGEPLPVPVPVNEDALRQIAEGTNGTFFAAQTEGELRSIYDDIGSSIGFEVEQQEVTHRYVGIALVALLAAAAMSLAWFARLP